MEKTVAIKNQDTSLTVTYLSIIKQLKCWQTEEMLSASETITFVPLFGSYNPYYKGTLALDQELSQFVNDDMKKVMLLAGHSGAGKSVASARFIQSLWDRYEPGDPIPLWISLPSIKNPEVRVLEETLEKAGLTDDQIQDLKAKQSFTLVLDAYDEIHCTKNLYITNKLHEWRVNLIVTCRHEYLYHIEGFNKLFTPFHHGKPNYVQSEVVYVKPFNQEQIEQYLKQYLDHHRHGEWGQWSQYAKVIDDIPGLKTLIENPYVLKLAVEVLPEICKRYEGIGDEFERKALTRAVLYDVFIEQWFMRQEDKLKANGQIEQDEDIKPIFWDYVKRLSQAMHEHQLTQVYYDPDDVDDLFGSEEGVSPFGEFFDPDDQRLEMIRSSCLLREVTPKHYGFVHSSLMEYFLTRNLFESLIEEKQTQVVNPEGNANSNSNLVQKNDYFNLRLMVDEERIIQFLADRVLDEEDFKNELLARLDGSKNRPDQSISGANAITILVKAGITFNRADLRSVQIPGADLSGGNFAFANFEKANLSNVIFSYANLRNTRMRACQLNGVNFGEYPSYIDDDNMVESFDYRPELNRLFSANGNHLTLWDLNSHRKLKSIDYKLKVTQVQASKNGEWLVTSSSDGFITRWNLKNFENQSCYFYELKYFQVSDDGTKIAVLSDDHQYGGIYVCTHSFGNRLDKKHEYKDESFLPAGYATAWGMLFTNEYFKVVYGSSKGLIRLRQSPNWDDKHELSGHTDAIFSLQFSSGGSLLASGDWSGTIRLWGLANQLCLRVITGHDWRVSTLQYSTDTKLLVSGSWDKTIKLWDAQTGECLVADRGQSDFVKCVQFDPRDGGDKRIISSANGGAIRLWSIDASRQEHHDYYVSHQLILINSTQTMSICFGSCFVRVFDLNEEKCLNIFKHNDIVDCATFSHDNKKIATGSQDCFIRIWDLESGQCLITLKGHDAIHSLSFSHDDKKLASLAKNRTAHIWDIANGSCLAVVKDKFENIKEVKAIQFNSDDSKIMMSDDNHILHRKFSLAYDGRHKRGISTIIFNHEQSMVIACGGTVSSLWDVKTGKYVSLLGGHYSESSVLCATFSRDDTKVITGSTDTTIIVWDVVTGIILNILYGNTTAVMSLNCSHDGKLLVSGGREGEICIWNLETGDCIKTLKDHVEFDIEENDDDERFYYMDEETIMKHHVKNHGEMVFVRFSSDDKRILTGSSAGYSQFWDVSSGESLKKIHLNASSFDYSPDEQLIVSNNKSSCLNIWDVATEKSTLQLKGHEEPIEAIGLYNNQIVSVSLDGTMRFWSIETGQQLNMLSFHISLGCLCISARADIFCVGLKDGSLQCWQFNHTENLWEYRWGSLNPHDRLIVTGCDITDCDTLSTSNIRLLEQNGAIRQQKGSAMIAQVGKNTRSPLHTQSQYNDEQIDYEETGFITSMNG